MTVFITPYTDAKPGNGAYFVHISSASLEGETCYHASNWETYLKMHFFLIYNCRFEEHSTVGWPYRK